MTDAEFEQLKTREREAYAKFQAAKAELKSFSDPWLEHYRAVDKEKLRREMRAEIEKEKQNT